MQDTQENVQETPAPRHKSPSWKVPFEALTPPPASVPSEFLDSQSPPAPVESAIDITPPPASVPSEFLVQQEPLVPLAVTPASQMEDYLRSGDFGSNNVEPGVWPLLPEGEELTEPNEVGAVPEAREPVQLRGVPLAEDEEIASVLLTDEGVTDSLPRTGPALILTNQRIIAFRGVEGFRDTHIASTSDIRQFSVRTGQRNWGAVLQGFLMMVSGGFLYLVVAYWLTGQIRGPNVPVINIDVAPLIALLIILAGLLVLLQNYFTRPAGALIFRGPGVEIAFPFRSALDIHQIYEFADHVKSTGSTQLHS